MYDVNESNEDGNTTTALATMEDIAVLERRESESVFARSGFLPSVAGQMTLTEQQARAGLDFEVETAPLFHQHGNGYAQADRYVAVRNATSGKVFSIAKSGYVPLQWSTMDVLQPVVDAGLGDWDGILVLRGGALGVARVKLKQAIRVPGDESPIAMFLNVVVPHDKTLRWSTLASATRPICENTLRAALRESAASGYALKVRHTRNAEARVETARKVFDRSMSQFAQLAGFAERSARTAMSDRQFTQVVERMLPARKDGEVTKSLSAAREKALDLWNGEARGLNGIRGTAWAAVQVVSEYADHYTKIRGEAADRADSILFGRSNDMKGRGIEAIEEVVGELV